MKKSVILLSAAALLSLAACGGHTHTFASEWTYDDTNHWHAATCEHADQKDGVAAHTIGADGKCTVCDYQQHSYTKMTEEQFNALVNKIKTQGIAAQFDLLAKSGDVVLAKEKASFKFDIASTSLEELSYNDTGAVVDGSVLKDLTEYKFKSGGWSVGDTLTEPQAKQTLGHELEGMCEQFFPSQTYADYSFDETTGKYTVDFTSEQQLHIVFVYTMDANGITKIEGTTSGEYEGVNVVSTVNTSSVNVGPQTIVKPDVPEKDLNEVSEQEWVAAFGQYKPFYIADNYKLEVNNQMGEFSSTGTLIADGNKLKSVDPKETYYFEIVDSQKYQYSQNETTKKWSKSETDTTAADDVAPYFIMFATNYSKFQFDKTDKTYKCSSLSYSGAEYTNLKIKFENKKILSSSCDTKMPISMTDFIDVSMTFNFTYGGQTVSLPEIQEGNMSKQDFDALVNGINTIGFKYECDLTQSANDEEIYSGGIVDIFNSKVHSYNLFSYEGKYKKLRIKLADRKLCRQENNNTWELVTRYKTDEEALEDWTAKKEERLTYVLPSLNFADYVYDGDNETYSISKTIHIYENDFVIRATVDMDKEGINSTYGTLTYETKDLKIVYTFDTTAIVIGEYEITSPIL